MAPFFIFFAMPLRLVSLVDGSGPRVAYHFWLKKQLNILMPLAAGLVA